MVDQIVIDALDHLKAARAWYALNKVYENYKLSTIWQVNLDRWFNNLFLSDLSSVTAKQVIGFLHDKAFFDVSVPQPQLPHAIDWFFRNFFRDATGWPFTNGNLIQLKFQESELFSDDRCETRHGARVSTDFLWRAAIIKRMMRHIPIVSEKSLGLVVELGSGSGNFARAVKLLYPKTTYVCIDLPESLFFAEVYLRSNFPEASCLHITEPIDNVGALSDQDFDFVFIPTDFTGALKGQRVDLFVNMNSMGEMTNEVIAHWFKFIQETIRVDHILLLNRFLNRVDPRKMEYRKGESSCSLMLDPNWDILDWEVDPDFERSPYLTTLITRNLLVIAQRMTGPGDIQELVTRAEAVTRRLPAIEMEDWARRPYWDQYVLKSGDAGYPPLNCRGDLNFTPDLTKTGSLFAVWEAFRLTRSRKSIELLIEWMMSHGGLATPFEELFYLDRVGV